MRHDSRILMNFRKVAVASLTLLCLFAIGALAQSKVAAEDAKCNDYFAQHNYSGALTWYKKSAVLGNADAMKNIGNMYFSGDGIPQDYKQAMN